jgi:hypothetical protein
VNRPGRFFPRRADRHIPGKVPGRDPGLRRTPPGGVPFPRAPSRGAPLGTRAGQHRDLGRRGPRRGAPCRRGQGRRPLRGVHRPRSGRARGTPLRIRGSIDLDKAMSGEALLATHLNGAPLSPMHGFPHPCHGAGLDRCPQRQMARSASTSGTRLPKTISSPRPTALSARSIPTSPTTSPGAIPSAWCRSTP